MADREALKKWLQWRAAQSRNLQNMRRRGTRPLGGGPGMLGKYSPNLKPMKPSKNPNGLKGYAPSPSGGRRGPEKRYY